ncbi:hypothetical protein [Klebsiella quasivariicola]|nr:hypothetical protein [Klebsiella quasivariicola]
MLFNHLMEKQYGLTPNDTPFRDKTVTP